METPLDHWKEYPFGVQVLNSTVNHRWVVEFKPVLIKPDTPHLLGDAIGATKRFKTFEDAQGYADKAALQWAMNWTR